MIFTFAAAKTKSVHWM